MQEAAPMETGAQSGLIMMEMICYYVIYREHIRKWNKGQCFTPRGAIAPRGSSHATALMSFGKVLIYICHSPPRC